MSTLNEVSNKIIWDECKDETKKWILENWHNLVQIENDRVAPRQDGEENILLRFLVPKSTIQ